MQAQTVSLVPRVANNYTADTKHNILGELGGEFEGFMLILTQIFYTTKTATRSQN